MIIFIGTVIFETAMKINWFLMYRYCPNCLFKYNKRASYRRLLADHTSLIATGLKKVHDFDEFFHHLSELYECVGHNHEITLTSEGLMSINSELDIHPEAFMAMSVSDRKTAFNVTRDYQAGKLDDTSFESLSSQERITFNAQLRSRRNDVCKVLRGFIDKEINGWAITRDILPYHWDALYTAVEKYTKKTSNRRNNVCTKLTTVLTNFALKQNCINHSQLSSLIQFLNIYVGDVASSTSKEIAQVLQDMANQSSTLFTDLNSKFQSLLQHVIPFNTSSTYRFGCHYAATYHVYKHDDGTQINDETTVRKYFGDINALFIPANQSQVKLMQEGNTVRKVYRNTSTGMFGTLIENRRDANNVEYVMTTFKK